MNNEKIVHYGVGAIITNKSKTLFFIQKKDKTYPIKEYREKFSLFGGKIEPEETELSALKREIKEEINESEKLVLKGQITKIGDYKINSINGNYKFTLFEIIIPDKLFDQLKNSRIDEGAGIEVNLDKLKQVKWIWGLEKAISSYLEKFY